MKEKWKKMKAGTSEERTISKRWNSKGNEKSIMAKIMKISAISDNIGCQ